MRTTFITPEESAKKFMEIIQNTDTCGIKRPERFEKIMHENRGSVQFLIPFAPQKTAWNARIQLSSPWATV